MAAIFTPMREGMMAVAIRSTKLLPSGDFLIGIFCL
jgi:hypothetical protein